MRSSFWPATIGGSLILLALIVLPDSSGGEVTVTIPFAASEDTFVKSTRPNTNYGQANTVQADTHPSTKRTLLRFTVSGIPQTATLQSATLRLYVVGRSKHAGTVSRVNGSWDEATARWSNAPAVAAEVAKLTGTAAAGTWKETDVTAAVTGNGTVDFYVITASRDGVDYASTESGQHPPTLAVRWTVPSIETGPTPQPTLAPTATPSPVSGSGVTYYVDSASGNDANSGTSEAAAWRTLSKATNAALNPGDRLLFKRGGVWSGTLTMAESGTADKPITVGAYGSGALPIIQGGGDCVSLSGSRIIVTQIQAHDCAWAGIKIAAGATFNRVDGNLITQNVAGIHVGSGSSDNTIVGNTLQNNNKMSVLTASPTDDDSGAFGVLLNGDRNDVLSNTISGSDAFSYDYGRDGAAVEVYGGLENHIHHNLAVDNRTFSELGNSRSRDNTFAYNIVRSALSDATFLVTRGAQSSYGPVLNTRLYNNSVVMTGSGSQGFVCHAGCSSSVLSMRNNVIQAVWKVGYADAAFDEDYDLFAGGTTQFALGAHSMTADPQFVNASAGDLHLASPSPAVDSGVNSGYGTDFDGAHVPHDGNGDGVVATDRGALEKLSSVSVATPAPTPVPTVAPTPTPPPSSGDAVLVGAGDISSCSTNGDEETAKLLDAILGTVFTLGDNVYEDGTAQQFSDCYNPTWGRHKIRTRPAPGNHDYHTSGGAGYYGYFGSAATPQEPGCASWCKGWYSYNAGSWHVIVLNSECATSYNACDEAAMLSWLQQDLSANTTACTVAMWHRPVLTIGPHSNDEAAMKPFWRMLYDYNAELVLNGHEHSYARYAPLNREADGVDAGRGIRQIVAGTGGKGLTTATRTGSTPGLEVWQDAATANTLGVLKLTLRSGSFDWQFVPVAGKSFTDSGAGVCH